MSGMPLAKDSSSTASTAASARGFAIFKASAFELNTGSVGTPRAIKRGRVEHVSLSPIYYDAERLLGLASLADGVALWVREYCGFSWRCKKNFSSWFTERE